MEIAVGNVTNYMGLSVPKLLTVQVAAVTSDVDLSAEFTDFYERNRGSALKFVLLRTVGHTDPESIMHEAFMLLWEESVKKGKLCERGWFFKVLRNKIGNVYQSMAVRDAEAARIDPSWVLDIDQVTITERLETRRALAKLSERDRDVLDLVYGLGLSTAEAAQALSIREAALRKRLSRARKEFERVFSGSGDSAGEKVGVQEVFDGR